MAACATKPRPPVYNLWSHARVAVLPFANASRDPALAGEVRDAVVAELKRLDAVAVADAPGTSPAGSASPWADAAWRAGVAAATGCDLLLVGSVANYGESLKSEEPKRVKSRLSYGSRWGWADLGTAHLDAVLRLVDAKTGAVVWSRAVPGDGKQGRWTELGWPGDTSSAPAEGWDALKAAAAPAPAAAGADGLLRGVEPLVTAARADAIAEVVRTVASDFVGRDGWEPPARPSAPAAAPAATGATPSP
jgi:TolB-like protein